MTVALAPAELSARPAGGGAPARRAVVRWAWRLFRREWRQQLLVLGLVVVAVAATVVGGTVATTTPQPADFGFGTARAMATFSGSDPRLAAQLATLRQHAGPLEVIENETLTIPGTIESYELRAESPAGRFSGPMLSLVAGRYPRGAGEVALTADVASDFGVKLGGLWRQGAVSRKVVGIVENPLSLLDEFALVVPGQVRAPTEVTVLFDPRGPLPASVAPSVSLASSAAAANVLNPVTIVLALATVGMLLIALVAVGGFTVLAQRRLRSLGMLGSLGATDKHVALVVRVNGVVVGFVGAVLGLVLGLVAWLVYRPQVEASAHHLIGLFSLPWIVIGPAMALAVLATYFAASRPARAITRVPIVAALSGRPAPPRHVRRSVIPGVILIAASFASFTLAGKSNGNGGGAAELVAGFVALIVGVILCAPFSLALFARAGRRAPMTLRLALRDLSRYRARSGPALAAISIGVLIAAVISVVAAGRYANVLDYAGPNLANNQLMIYTPSGPYGPNGPASGAVGSGTSAPALAAMAKAARSIAASLGVHRLVELENTSATLLHAAPGRNFTGPLFVATPQLLRAFGIRPVALDPHADVLTMRPGLAGMSKILLVYGNYFQPVANGGAGGAAPNAFPCPKRDCLVGPVIEEATGLPSGTSAPNTVLTEHAVHTLRLQTGVAGWMLQTPAPLSASQIDGARRLAAAAGMSIETKSDAPSSAEIINWATVFGIALALGILAMSVGLIRSETADELRTLAATGASSFTRRGLTAATAGALALAGAVLGTAGAYVASAGWFSSSPQNGGLATLSSAPVGSLLLLLVGMPLLAALAGWLLAGREPPAMAHQPIE